MNAFRAYFRLNGVAMAEDPDSECDDDEFVPEGGGNVKSFVIDIEYDPTGIRIMEPQTAGDLAPKQGAAVVNLAGQRIDNTQWHTRRLKRGIYIVGGRKEVLK